MNLADWIGRVQTSFTCDGSRSDDPDYFTRESDQPRLMPLHYSRVPSLMRRTDVSTPSNSRHLDPLPWQPASTLLLHLVAYLA